ncbi:MAG: Hsp20/alpha crystallin family protein [Halobacteria archaeon]
MVVEMTPLPRTPGSNWIQGMENPSEIFNWDVDEGVELREEEGEYLLTMEMPGFERDAIEVNYYDERLNVSAEQVDDSRNRQRRYHRTFRLPQEVEPEDIDATYRNGVLEVTLPIKTEEEKRGYEIEVKEAQ